MPISIEEERLIEANIESWIDTFTFTGGIEEAGIRLAALGEMYYLGKEREVNIQKAIFYFCKSYRYGVTPFAQYCLGKIYANGFSNFNGKVVIPKNVVRAVSWLSTLISHGSKKDTFDHEIYPKGATILAKILISPVSLHRTEDEDEYIKKYSLAAIEDGFATLEFFEDYSQYTRERRNKSAIKLLQMAGKFGNSEALFLLGQIYEAGVIVEKNNRKAAGYYLQAKEAGHEAGFENAKRLIAQYEKEKTKGSLEEDNSSKQIKKGNSKKRKDIESALTKKPDQKSGNSSSFKKPIKSSLFQAEKRSSSSSTQEINSFDDDIPITEWVKKPKRLLPISSATKKDRASTTMEVSPILDDALSSSSSSSSPTSESQVVSSIPTRLPNFVKGAMIGVLSSSNLALTRPSNTLPLTPVVPHRKDKPQPIVAEEKLLSSALKPTQTNVLSEQKVKSNTTFSDSPTKKIKQSSQPPKTTAASLSASPRRTTTKIGKSRQLTILDIEFIPEPGKLNYSSVRFFKPELKQKPKPIRLPVTSPQDQNQVKPKRVEKQERLTEEAKRQIGRWGENCVYQKLKQHYENKYHGKAEEVADGFILEGVDDNNNKVKLEVRWYNKTVESYNNIDFMVIKNKNGVTKERYIEVKTTTSDEVHKATFPASEWQAILTYKEKYSIYRVFNAGQSEKVRIEKIKNPLEKIVQGELGVESIRLEI